ncbi:FecR domain-containing protein [Paludibacter sp.]|uniref:FecR family protein n=1 Tax=Paludibacter sp. TaxID=1898105 RepID=UPI001352BEB9|nr:FecR domain-containing protein [Paludibacter sp.]MTK53435.1 DUF4974 domain-containing protein [Paludibacter sp.]
MKNFEIYQHYTVENWLDDPDFIQWIKNPEENSNEYFAQILKGEDEAAETLQQAKAVLEAITGSGKRLSDIEVAHMWREISQSTIHKPRIWKALYTKTVAVASVILLCLAVSIVWIFRNNNELQHFAQYLSVDSLQEIQLVMPDKKQMTLANQTEVKLNAKGDMEVDMPKGDRIVMETEGNSKDICQLIVPGGKRAYLVLTDGTRISVHPGSKVVFPIQFALKQRKVYLEGEAFLEVTKNPSRPFFVQTKQMEVSVLGTSFNVMAYPKQNTQSVVLVTGHVKVKSENGEERRIEPNQCYTFDKNALVDKIETVSTDEYTGWKDGVLNFSSEPLSQILEKVSNYYNVSLRYSISTMNTIRLSGKLDLNNTIEGALKVLTTVAPIEIKNQNSQYVVNVKP